MRRFLILTVLLAVSAGGLATADPVEVNEEQTTSERGQGVCSLWYDEDPEGEGYIWTDLCAWWEDSDGDGTADERIARLDRTPCNDPPPASWCYGPGDRILRQEDLTTEQFDLDLDAGTAHLEVSADGCALSVTWTATSDVSSSESTGYSTPRSWRSGTRVGITSPRTTNGTRSRDASQDGALCAAAGDVGTYWGSYMLEYERSEQETSVSVDPLG